MQIPPFFLLDISIQAPTFPTLSGLLLMRSVFILFFISVRTYFFTKPYWVAGRGECFLLYLTDAQITCLSPWLSKAKLPCTPSAICTIRRIMATCDFHHWSVVYHSLSKSLLTRSVHVYCKMGCQTMLGRRMSRLASEGDRCMDSLRGFSE